MSFLHAKKPHHAVMYRVLILLRAGGCPPHPSVVPEGRNVQTRVRTPEENVLAQNCDITRTWQGYLIHK